MAVLIGFAILLVMGLPVAFVLGMTGFLHLIAIDNEMFFRVFPQRMFSALDSFSLLAIPFFVLTGEIMNQGGITTRLIGLVRNLVGHMRGGLAYVNIVVGLFLAAIVGSANAEAAIRSKIIVPEMVKDGYDDDYAAAITATSSIIGPIIPPSMVFIVYGVIAGTSIGALFLAGIVPGLLITGAQLAVAYWYAKRKNFPVRPRSSMKNALSSLVMSIPALLIPLVIIGGVLSGVFTPTESGAIAVVIALLIGFFFYRTLKISHLKSILLDTGIISASVMLIISYANILGWTLAMERVPSTIASALLGISDNPYVILLLINILLLILGMFMETFSAMIILVPVLLPVIVELGIDPVHFGLIMCLNLTIGLITPPVGVTLFVTSDITKVPIERLIKASTPFVIASIVVLLVVTYWEDAVMFFPRLWM